MLKRVQHDKNVTQNSSLSGFTTVGSICSLSGIHSLSFTHSVRKFASWICSARPYPPSAGREFRFRTCGSCQLNSFAIRTNSLRSHRPYANPLSWICSTLTEFCLSGFTTVGSICSLSGIHSLSFTHSVRKSANQQ